MSYMFNNFDQYSEMEPTTESDNLIMTAALLESNTHDEIQAFLESDESPLAIREGVLMEKTIVKLDKNAQVSQARKMAIFTIAKEKNDINFRKLVTIWRMERKLEGVLDKKYGPEATRRAKKAVNKRRNSRVPIIQKTVKKTNTVLNGGKPSTAQR